MDFQQKKYLMNKKEVEFKFLTEMKFIQIESSISKMTNLQRNGWMFLSFTKGIPSIPFMS